MTRLAELQAQFQDYLLTGNTAIAPHITDDPRVGCEARLTIYSDAYRLRLIEALDADYAAVRAIAGDELYEAVVNDYIYKHPSVYPNIRWYGDKLAAFIAEDSRCAGQPELVELARFEWAMTLVFDAPDQPVLSLEALAALSTEAWPDLQFIIQDALQLLDLTWNTPALWKFARQNTPRPPLECHEPPVTWMLWRQKLSPYFRSMPPDEADALRAVIAGETFADICERLVQWHHPDVIAMRAMTLIRQWQADGIITGYR